MDQVAERQRPPAGPQEPQEPLYRCAVCLDNVFVEKEITRYGDRCLVAWFCDCETGRRAQAGHWFDKSFPRVANHREESPAGQAALRAYLVAQPLERRWLPDAVEALRLRYEQERRRHLASMNES